MKLRSISSSSPLISVVIVTWKNYILFKRGLSSILKTNYPNFEIIIIINEGGDDGTLAYIKRIVKKTKISITYRIFETNIGHAEGVNVGVDLSSGDYIAKIDDDAHVDKNWLKELVFFYTTHKDTGQIQSNIITDGKLLKKNNKKLAHVTLTDRVGLSIKTFLTTDPVELFFATGCTMFIRRDIFLKVGGYDKDFIIYVEEVDLGWRLRLMGYHNYIVPNSVVYHRGGSTIRRNYYFSQFHYKKNHILMMLKNYNLMNVLRYLPLYIFLMFGDDIISLLKKRKVRGIQGSFAALLWNMHNFLNTLYKRKKVNALRKVNDDEIKKYMIPLHVSLKYIMATYVFNKTQTASIPIGRGVK